MALALLDPDFHLTPVRFAVTTVVAAAQVALNLHGLILQGCQLPSERAGGTQRQRLTGFGVGAVGAGVRSINLQRCNDGLLSARQPALTNIGDDTDQRNPIQRARWLPSDAIRLRRPRFRRLRPGPFPLPARPPSLPLRRLPSPPRPRVVPARCGDAGSGMADRKARSGGWSRSG